MGSRGIGEPIFVVCGNAVLCLEPLLGRTLAYLGWDGNSTGTHNKEEPFKSEEMGFSLIAFQFLLVACSSNGRNRIAVVLSTTVDQYSPGHLATGRGFGMAARP